MLSCGKVWSESQQISSILFYLPGKYSTQTRARLMVCPQTLFDAKGLHIMSKQRCKCASDCAKMGNTDSRNVSVQVENIHFWAKSSHVHVYVSGVLLTQSVSDMDVSRSDLVVEPEASGGINTRFCCDLEPFTSGRWARSLCFNLLVL